MLEDMKDNPYSQSQLQKQEEKYKNRENHSVIKIKISK